MPLYNDGGNDDEADDDVKKKITHIRKWDMQWNYFEGKVKLYLSGTK